MVIEDRVVVRMFSCKPDTVRWETRIVDGGGLSLKVFGPGSLKREQTFASALSLVEYQVQYEQQLWADGYTVLPLSERRTGRDRRRRTRTKQDRRRSE